MKISLISNLYEPYARGGAEIIVKRSALELVQQGHEVTIITAMPWMGFPSLYPQKQVKDGLTIIRFYPLNLFFYRNDYKWAVPFRLLWHFFDLCNLHSAFTVKRILKEIQPDRIITHNLMGLGYLLPRVIKHQKISHTHVLHDIQLAVRSGLMKKGQESAWFVTGGIARLYQSIVKRLFGSPDTVISPSQFLLDFYVRLGYFPHSNKEVIRNPIDQRFFVTEALLEKKKNDEITTFACIGQLAEHKGLKTLRMAFSSISNPNIRLLIVGSGPLEAEMREWAEQDSRVEFKGRIPNEELPKFYQSIDVTILPTETYENSPTVVFESLASGVPVIASDIGGTAEPLEEGKTGFLFEPGNVEQLSAKINEAIGKHHMMRKTCLHSLKKNLSF